MVAATISSTCRGPALRSVCGAGGGVVWRRTFYFAAGAGFVRRGETAGQRRHEQPHRPARQSPANSASSRKFSTSMAESLQQRVKERELAEKTLLNRALQQTVVAALGQFALTNSDLDALLNQAVMLAGQTLGSGILRRCLNWLPDGQLLLQAGTGWKSGCIGKATCICRQPFAGGLHARHRRSRSWWPTCATETQVRCVAVVDGPWRRQRRHRLPFPRATGRSACSASTRRSTGNLPADEVQFLLAAATAIGMAVERKRAEAETAKARGVRAIESQSGDGICR